MKLADHVEHIRQLIDKCFRNCFGRMGINASAMQPVDAIPAEYREERNLIESIREVFIDETGTVADAYEKLVEEFTFTLFNRLAALKVMEAHTLQPEIVTRRSQHGDRSFAHFLWLEQNPDGRNEEQEGLVRFLENQLATLAADIPLFSPQHPYHLLPTAIELNGIMNAFNQVETDAQVENNIWKSDDVLGWLYESYNNYKKVAHKESKAKTEYNKVSIQSQVYTPRWVVKFLVDNSLGKLYLEMFPDSAIKEKYKIANAPKKQTRERKPITEIRLIDPTTGSGNFLLYGFDLFYDLYTDQIDNYGADYDENRISELIIRYNLHGVDLDDRAVQLAQLGLYIKAKRKKRSVKIEHFNIVSSDFFLPNYAEVRHLFVDGKPIDAELEKIVIDLWADLQQAYKFGSLIRLDDEFNNRLHKLIELRKKEQGLFSNLAITEYEKFRETFFVNLQKAVEQNTVNQGVTFLNTKAQDAITFLQLMTQKYDVAVANPPYTDSGDFGPELKGFVEKNYKKPYKFNANLYAVFINRCIELIDTENGKVGMLHPLTFMYISSFKDVRAYLLEKTHINILAELGLGGVFANSNVQVDVVAYVIEKNNQNENSIFLDFKKYKNHTNKPNIFLAAYANVISSTIDEHIHIIDQSKLKIIEGWPFIYWISDGFREKFKENALNKKAKIVSGFKTGNNEGALRFWWELNLKETDENWAKYTKGGPFNKWFGNVWLMLNIKNKFSFIKKQNSFNIPNEEYVYKDGITYNGSGSKGVSFRLLESDTFYDMGSSAIFAENSVSLLSILNTKLVYYITDCLNPTVNKQPNDIVRIPFVKPSKELEKRIFALASQNIEIKKHLNSYRVIETKFEINPLIAFSDAALRDRLLAYLNYENAQLALVLLNEAIINQLIFEVYALSPEDRQQVETKMGKPVAELSILPAARDAYLSAITIENKTVKEFIQNLAAIKIEDQKIQAIKSEFTTLYKGNNDLEEFCIRHQLNPINVWFWFRESKLVPQGRAAETALEFLVDACRAILMEDEDGIIPLVGLPGEPCLFDRLEKYCLDKGFTSAQFMQLDGLLGSTINDFIENKFFQIFSDHVKLFKQLPSTPFIWHLSSGLQKGFEVYIIIYKWNRDSLFKIKTQYLNKRVEGLQYRQIQLSDSNTAQAQNEKETIRLQLQEITEFTKKIDELIAEDYDPKLDDGVGKNIAPLQKKGLLRSEVLNKKQLEKYLKADW